MTIETVVIHATRSPEYLLTHEGHALVAVARALAALRGSTFGGVHEPSAVYPGPLFFVPDETLTRREATTVGITGAEQMFGGVVPFPFVRTKTITHPLVDRAARRPPGWSEEFAAAVRDAVLPGFTVFTARDAGAAARALFPAPIRVKRPLAAGGRGQTVLGSMEMLDALLAEVGTEELAEHGLVLELDLAQVTTATVGHISVGDMTMTYHGTQTSTTSNAGREVYGGSDLVCVRGGWPAMTGLAVSARERLAIAQARAYDEASATHYEVMASRRNYDVAQGVDKGEQFWSGVLESSWRAGGASGAEMAALEAFTADPQLAVVTTSCREVYGEDLEPPPGARVSFHGVDPHAGPMLRYALMTGTAGRAAA